MPFLLFLLELCSSYFVGALVLGSVEPGGSPSHPQSLFHRLCYPLASLSIPFSPVCFGPSVQHRLDGYAGDCPWGAGPFPVWAHGSGRAAFAWLSILSSLCVSLQGTMSLVSTWEPKWGLLLGGALPPHSPTSVPWFLWTQGGVLFHSLSWGWRAPGRDELGRSAWPWRCPVPCHSMGKGAVW